MEKRQLISHLTLEPERGRCCHSPELRWLIQKGNICFPIKKRMGCNFYTVLQNVPTLTQK